VERTIGRYRLARRLGEGATGIVWLAFDSVGAPVALKLLRPELSHDDVHRRRFVRELRLARAIEHPNVLAVHATGIDRGCHYLVVRYVEGPSLARRLSAAGPLPIGEALHIVADVASGLDALHRAGLVHRDVKPSNVLLEACGSAILADLGLARGDACSVVTHTGHVLGSVDYLAPELISGAPASPRSDIYALGCLAYALLAGAPPFAGRRPFETTVAHLAEDPTDPGCGRALAQALLVALAKDPSRRPATAGAYAGALLNASS
jgi:serine/threonine-protein kinase